MGWGWQDYHHESPSSVLKEEKVTLIDSANCGMADALCTEGSTGPARLKTPATLNKIVSSITLPKTESEEISKDCMVMGWGWKKYHHESPSNILKEANVTLLDSENCGTSDTLCTEGSTGPAQTSSGGPLFVCGGVAQGIVSFFKDKRNADHLTVYTHISHYLPWIQSIMSPEKPEMLDQVSTPGILDLTADTDYQKPPAVFCLVPKT
ncbi:hypothetical protein Q8A67_005942 [Cirrhinus molitorella]|uniref:Peptidase S1 domain-containing protein n=1 Tax=Cirrhinus molitorella TaxID=172907 RepID=A0AA88PZC8_9TELE|nr:hypothetical protein Q8A67_005942 [Cirrhinus molitorella]